MHWAGRPFFPTRGVTQASRAPDASACSMSHAVLSPVWSSTLQRISTTRSVTAILGMFASVALALAALGLYGVLAFFVTKRVHEIGIRVALGASGGKVLRLVITKGMILVGVGSILGIAGALGATRLVDDMLFQVTATDPVTYVGVTGIFLLVALGACVLPAWRAIRVDPVEAFRAE